MRDLTDYGGEPLFPASIEDFFRLLERDGFTIGVSKQPTFGNKRWTLLVRWRDVKVAYTRQDMWGGAQPTLLGHHFGPGSLSGADACPPGFHLAAFSALHGCSPEAFYVRRDGNGKSYLRIRSAESALRVLHASAREVDGMIFGDASPLEGSPPDELETDLSDIRNRDIPETTKKRLVDARIGQGEFRSNLLRLFNQGCAVTGLRLRAALRASHVVPWRTATDLERLDPNNGLLLSANLDALFDKFLITFGREGAIRVSPAILKQEQELLGPLQNLRGSPSEQQWQYLALHNKEFDRVVREHQLATRADE